MIKDFGYTYTDSLSLAYHTFAAKKLKESPELLEVLKARNAWCDKNPALKGSKIYISEWEKILSQGIEPTIAMFLEESDHGQVMRSCSPIVAIVTQEERTTIMEAWKADHGGKLSGAILH